tara:strand:- start:505 stop:1029 length:525 start_codon:yes stop_codon:yes gene_type:complete
MTLSNIKLFFTDIDGVWTDGGMYYSENGVELKKFNTLDAAGVLLLRNLNIEIAIISGERTDSVKKRAHKLGIDNCFLGVKNKLATAKSFIDSKNISFEECAHIGDDYNDIELLKKVGLSACPSNARTDIKNIVEWSLKINGGDGAFCAFVEKYLTDILKIEPITIYKNIYGFNI